ncbi:hypothetical protein H206_00788 [Candidatus Electrothrix aarhusensis]|uniref:Uncharacterized protein n=1 Tax=Candidatus Electrothrix aarhusensis TaxID=1859131 RepID=A0A444IZD9_9BACT|nr:hypothetical protein H206_00788 [Candidatus Electrothrix aarhusensis]
MALLDQLFQKIQSSDALSGWIVALVNGVVVWCVNRRNMARLGDKEDENELLHKEIDRLKSEKNPTNLIQEKRIKNDISRDDKPLYLFLKFENFLSKDYGVILFKATSHIINEINKNKKLSNTFVMDELNILQGILYSKTKDEINCKNMATEVQDKIFNNRKSSERIKEATSEYKKVIIYISGLEILTEKGDFFYRLQNNFFHFFADDCDFDFYINYLYFYHYDDKNHHNNRLKQNDFNQEEENYEKNRNIDQPCTTNHFPDHTGIAWFNRRAWNILDTLNFIERHINENHNIDYNMLALKEESKKLHKALLDIECKFNPEDESDVKRFEKMIFSQQHIMLTIEKELNSIKDASIKEVAGNICVDIRLNKLKENKICEKTEGIAVVNKEPIIERFCSLLKEVEEFRVILHKKLSSFRFTGGDLEKLVTLLSEYEFSHRCLEDALTKAENMAELINRMYNSAVLR